MLNNLHTLFLNIVLFLYLHQYQYVSVDCTRQDGSPLQIKSKCELRMVSLMIQIERVSMVTAVHHLIGKILDFLFHIVKYKKVVKQYLITVVHI